MPIEQDADVTSIDHHKSNSADMSTYISFFIKQSNHPTSVTRSLDPFLPPPPPTKAMNHRKAQQNHQTQQIPTTTNHHHHFLWFTLIATTVKLLLIPSYHSTDFEVHRNWLALTHSLPLSDWYSDETSPWTLDYPPFFAYFEYLLSFFASLVDPTIVHVINGLNYKSQSTILFQRLSVILSDAVLFYGIYKITLKLNPKEKYLSWVLGIWAPGLIIVDHLHFQYNGFLLGMLLLSLAAVENEEDLFGGFFFAVLICFKHLFAVVGPVYFVYLLRHYCRGGLVKGFGKLVLMGAVVVAVFAAAYGPFVYYGRVFFGALVRLLLHACYTLSIVTYNTLSLHLVYF